MKKQKKLMITLCHLYFGQSGNPSFVGSAAAHGVCASGSVLVSISLGFAVGTGAL